MLTADTNGVRTSAASPSAPKAGAARRFSLSSVSANFGPLPEEELAAPTDHPELSPSSTLLHQSEGLRFRRSPRQRRHKILREPRKFLGGIASESIRGPGLYYMGIIDIFQVHIQSFLPRVLPALLHDFSVLITKKKKIKISCHDSVSRLGGFGKGWNTGSKDFGKDKSDRTMRAPYFTNLF